MKPARRGKASFARRFLTAPSLHLGKGGTNSRSVRPTAAPVAAAARPSVGRGPKSRRLGHPFGVVHLARIS
jgi:hypothetical protein